MHVRLEIVHTAFSFTNLPASKEAERELWTLLNWTRRCDDFDHAARISTSTVSPFTTA
jgi:hypothetical protein